ncbi:helix-turn-helix domain-containing protein [Trueperella pyogenes]|uniref:helix-turn-helix domain-containing protein n=1 Tax=Trueperella pyogenes TaxID=1661 RepID=UPI00345D866A
MQYTATVDIETSLDIDDALELLAPYHGAIADSKGGYRAVFTYDADTLSEASVTAINIAETLGTPYAIETAPTDLVDSHTVNGDIPPLVSVSGAAELLGITAQAVNKRLKSGTLSGTKVGNTWVIPLHSVL